MENNQRIMFCPRCGRNLIGDETFCPQCGNVLRETQVSEVQPVRPGYVLYLSFVIGFFAMLALTFFVGFYLFFLFIPLLFGRRRTPMQMFFLGAMIGSFVGWLCRFML